MSRDSFSGENLSHGPKKIENHWYRVYITFLQKFFFSNGFINSIFILEAEKYSQILNT